ncbi:MAG: hypothetical protein HY322_15685 [Betaproteobacteria bacterium]|nr:hypothetical protein [Betaproteobacteria bacterium]
MADHTLAGLVTESALEELAGDRYFERGLAYFRHGAVGRLRASNKEISARVEGSRPYAVRLWLDGRALDWDCTCPLGRDGEFCKHLVATGLAWLAGRDVDAGEAPTELQTIRAFLDAAEKRALVDLLVERAAEDDDFAGQLLLSAQRAGQAAPGALKETIRKAFSTSGFVDYGEMRRFASRAAPIPEMLRECLKQGDARTAAQLSAEAMKRGLRALEHSDDSDGLLGGILSDIAAAHLAAAKKGALPPADLARGLFDLQAEDGFGFFPLEPYVRALGKEGLAAYRKLAADAWKNVPPLEPGARASEDSGRRYQIADIMKTLARIDGSADAMVEVLRRDLSQPYAYVEIAQTLSKAKRHDEALKWAEDGRKAYPDHRTGPLADFLVAEYHRRKRHDDAVALRWAGFSRYPSLQAYEQLKHAANKAKVWERWREKALAVLSPAPAQAARPRHPGNWIDSKSAVLIQILLWERTPRAALEQARATGCSMHLWLDIARALEKADAADAIVIYQEQIDAVIAHTRDHAYEEAGKLAQRIGSLLRSTGRSAEFTPWLDALRARHKAKRNLLKRLESVVAA